MSYYTQAKLEYVITTMLTNGRQAKAQEILVKVGGNPAMLDEGQTLLQAWITSREAVDVLYGQKIEATAAEETIYKTAQAEISSLVETIYLFFNNNSAVLNTLGLPRRKSGGKKKTTATTSEAQSTPDTGVDNETEATAEATTAEPEDADGRTATETTEETSKPRTGSGGRVAELARWRRLCSNVKLLSNDDKTRLLRYEWDDARVDATLALLQTVVTADLYQQEMISAYETQKTVAQQDRANLEAWYRPLARLARKEIRKLAKALRAQYYALLAL
jgi:hypothetical protein